MLLRYLPPLPCYHAARGRSRLRNAGKMPLLQPPPPLPCCHCDSCRSAAADNAVLPSGCQAGRCHHAGVTIAAAALSPPCCCHATRCLHPTAMLLPPPPRCYRRLRVPPPSLCCRRHRHTAATTITVLPPPPTMPSRFHLRCCHTATKLPPPPLPLLQISSAIGVRVHTCMRISQPIFLMMHRLCVSEWMAKNTVPVSIWGVPKKLHLGTPRYQLP